jgi:hypothetical protein
MSEGKLKTPPPIIDPTTNAVRGRSVSFGVDDVDVGGPAGTSLAASFVAIGSNSSIVNGASY